MYIFTYIYIYIYVYIYKHPYVVYLYICIYIYIYHIHTHTRYLSVAPRVSNQHHKQIQHLFSRRSILNLYRRVYIYFHTLTYIYIHPYRPTRYLAFARRVINQHRKQIRNFFARLYSHQIVFTTTFRHLFIFFPFFCICANPMI